MRFYSDDPTKVTNVQWYFTGEKGPWLGKEYSFGSLVWDRKEEPQPDIGEIYHPHPWTNGKPPYCIVPGDVCGSDQQWTEGALSTDPIPPYFPGTLIPVCCKCQCPIQTGGNANGGNATAVEQVKFVVGGNANGGAGAVPASCPYCLSATPAVLPILFSGFPAPYTGMNQRLNLVYQGGCVWSVTSGIYTATATIFGSLSAPTFQIQYSSVPGQFATYREGSYNRICTATLFCPVFSDPFYGSSNPARVN